MNTLDKLTLKAFLAALMRLDNPLPDDLQHQLKEIGKALPSEVDQLDTLTEVYPPLEEEYLEARVALQNDGERFRSSAVLEVDDTSVLGEEKLLNFAAEVLTAEDSVNLVKQSYTESSELGQLLFQLRRQTSFIVRDAESIPQEELWVWENPEIWAALESGLQQAQAGQGRYLGDFSQYADLEDED